MEVSLRLFLGLMFACGLSASAWWVGFEQQPVTGLAPAGRFHLDAPLSTQCGQGYA